MPYITTRDGEKLHYLSAGRGAPVVLLHGFGMTGALWLPFVMPYAKRYRFILPDLRGFGFSHGLQLKNRNLLAQHADDLEDLLKALQLDRVILGGLSMGACTAMQYHKQYGFGRVRAYLNIDQSPNIRSSEAWPWGLMGRRHATRMAHGRELLKDCKDISWNAPFKTLPDDVRARFGIEAANFLANAMHNPLLKHGSARLMRHGGFGRLPWVIPTWRITLEAIRSYTEEDYDFRESLRSVKVPVRVFIGMNSSMYPAEGQLRIADYVPQAKIVRFENCGHAIPFDAPLRFTRELGLFLKAA